MWMRCDGYEMRGHHDVRCLPIVIVNSFIAHDMRPTGHRPIDCCVHKSTCQAFTLDGGDSDEGCRWAYFWISPVTISVSRRWAYLSLNRKHAHFPTIGNPSLRKSHVVSSQPTILSPIYPKLNNITTKSTAIENGSVASWMSRETMPLNHVVILPYERLPMHLWTLYVPSNVLNIVGVERTPTEGLEPQAGCWCWCCFYHRCHAY